jgi:D-alanyl-D-alanine carboxypeptidase
LPVNTVSMRRDPFIPMHEVYAILPTGVEDGIGVATRRRGEFVGEHRLWSGSVGTRLLSTDSAAISDDNPSPPLDAGNADRARGSDVVAVDLNDSRQADVRGWGPGWPNCNTSKWVELEILSPAGRVVRFPAHQVRPKNGEVAFKEEVSFGGSVREEIRELVSLLLQVSERRGFINLQPGWCWGGACRAIKRSDGTLTSTPSNHSWGLAVDINAPENAFGGSSHTIDRPMANVWNDYGFRWGGDYSTTKDWMHMEFMGSREDAKEMTEKARRELSKEVEELTPEQEKAIKRMSTFIDTLTEELGKLKGGPQDAKDDAAPAGAAKRVANAVLESEKE